MEYKQCLFLFCIPYAAETTKHHSHLRVIPLIPPSIKEYISIIMKPFTLSVNGQSRETQVAEDTPLLWVLRDSLGLTGTKFGCGKGLCGACTVHLDGQAVRFL